MQHANHVEPAFVGGYIGDVSGPDLAGSWGGGDIMTIRRPVVSPERQRIPFRSPLLILTFNQRLGLAQQGLSEDPVSWVVPKIGCPQFY
jgi:hypothetical protein